MSDDFLRVATKEINEDLYAISDALSKCKTNSDITAVSGELEKRMHKIKGLAPMMGKKDIGDLASLIDLLLKKINLGKKIDVLMFFKESSDLMTNSMNDSKIDCKPFYKKMKETYSAYLD